MSEIRTYFRPVFGHLLYNQTMDCSVFVIYRKQNVRFSDVDCKSTKLHSFVAGIIVQNDINIRLESVISNKKGHFVSLDKLFGGKTKFSEISPKFDSRI